MVFRKGVIAGALYCNEKKMKLRIDKKDLLDLTEKQLETFHKMFYPPYYQLGIIDKKILKGNKTKVVEITNEHGTYVYFPKIGKFYALPNIGQLLEYIYYQNKLIKTHDMFQLTWKQEDQLCDVLWNMVKENL